MSRRLGLLLAPVVILLVAWPTLGADDAADLLDRGRELMADRNYDAAIDVFRDLGRRYPESARAGEALLLAGKAHLYARRPAQAAEVFAVLLKDHAGSPWVEKARLLLADAHSAAGRHDLAADILKRRLETVESRAYKVMLAEHYRAVARTAFEGVPSSDALTRGKPVRDLPKAIRFFERARELLRGEPEEAELTVQIAEAAYDAGQPARTVQELSDFFKRFDDYPRPAAVRLLKARAHQRLGQTAQARTELEGFARADGFFKADASRPVALELLAETWFSESGERAVLKGVQVLVDALKTYPQDARAEAMSFRIGQALSKAGKLSEAAATLAAFRARFPKAEKAPAALLLEASALHRMQHYEEARAAWRTFVAAYSNHPEWSTTQRNIIDAPFVRAQELQRAKKPEEALTAYRAFLAEYPADRLSPRAQAAIARIHEDQKRLDQALVAYGVAATRYAKLDADVAAASQFRRAEILRLKKEDLDGAMEALQDLLKHFPGSGEAVRAHALIARLGARSLRVETERVFALGEPATLQVSTRNLEQLEFKAYPIDLAEYFRKKQCIDSIESVEVAIIKPALAWTVKTQGFGRYKDIERRVNLDVLKQHAPKGGAFIVAVRGDDLETRTLVVLSDLTVVLKKAPRQGLAFVLDEAAGKPAAGVEVLFSDGKKIVHSAKTDRDGVVAHGFAHYVADLRVLARRDGHTAFAGGKSRSAYTFGYKTKVYLYTDRPRYRPGHKVQWKGIARRVQEGVYRTPKDAPVRLQVFDSRGAALLDKETKTNAFGAFSDTLTLGGEAPLGTYRVVATFDKLTFKAEFEVAEYKKPEMFTRVKPARPDYLNGERVKATLEAGYFFGGPARRAKVSWRVFRARYAFDAAAYKDYAWFFEDEKSKLKSDGGPGEFVVSGQGVTDAEGKLEIAFDTGGKEGDWRYTVVAETRGRGRSVAYGSSSLFVTERAYYTVLRADKKAYRPQEAIRVDVTTVNARHEPVARSGKVELLRLGRDKTGATETVTASAPVTTGDDGRGEVKLQAPRGGDYAVRFIGQDRANQMVLARTGVAVAGDAEDLSRQARVVAEREIYYAGDRAKVLVNTPKAPAWVLLTFEGERVLHHRVIRLERRSNLLDLDMLGEYSPNVFLRVAIAADHKLHEAEDEVLVFKFLKVAVEADRAEYRPGDKASFTFRATDPKGKPVKTELSLAVVDRSLLEIAPDSGKDIKPFFYDQKRRRSVVTSSSLTFNYKARTKKVDPDLLGIEARERLQVELRKQQQLVKLAFAGSKLEREKKKLEAASGYLGRPRAASKVPYSGPAGNVPPNMQPPNSPTPPPPSGRWKGDRPAADKKNADRLADEDAEQTDFFASDVRGRAENLFKDTWERPDLAMFAAHVDAGAFVDFDTIQVRSRFLDTAAFLPHIETDADGKAVVEVTLPDNLTGWRAKAIGVGGDALVGSGETRLRVSKPLVARLDTPRFLTRGDRVRVATVLNNNTAKAQRIEVRFEVGGGKLSGDGQARLELPAHEAGRLDWDVIAPEVGAIKFTARAAEARADGARDGAELAIPTLPFGRHGRAAQSGTTTEGAVIPLKLPADIEADSARFALRLSPGYDAVILDSLDYLEGFPYGCLEQSVSRFLPAVAAAAALAKLGVDDPARAERYQKLVRAGLCRLYHMQNPDGGWGWWHRKLRRGGGRVASDPRMTAYALFGLETALRAGFKVDGKVLGRARGLAKQLAGRAPGYDVRAALLHALSINRQATINDLGQAYRFRDLLDAGGLARLALAYHRLNRPRNAGILVGMLRERVKEADGRAWWPTSSAVKGGWNRSALESTALALQALLRVEPSSRLVEPAVAYLMAGRKGRAFRSTKDTAAVILALVDYVGPRAPEGASYALAVEVNGHSAATARVVNGRLEGGRRMLVLDAKLFKAGDNIVRLVKQGPGRMHYAFVADWFTPAESVKAEGNLLKVERAYRAHAVEQVRDEAWVKPGWSVVISKFRPQEKKEPDLRELTAGEKVRVELTLTAREDLAYILVEDALPAGFEVVPETAQGPFNRFERRDDRAVFFFTKLKGSVTVSYVCRAIHPGAFRARPSFAAPMYEPEIWARGASAAIKIFDPDEHAAVARAEREPTADELYFGALHDLKKGRKDAARKKLAAVRKFRLRDEILDEVLAQLVLLDLRNQPKAAVTAYEELRDRNARKAAFDRAARIRLANAYAGLEEFERATGFYRQLLNESFTRERQVVASYVELGQPAKAQQVLLQLLQRYPDANAVVTDFYRRGLQFAEIRRPDFKHDPYLKTGAPTMRLEAVRELKVFTALYPASTLADDAQYHVVKLFGDLQNHRRAALEAESFFRRYPRSPWLDDVIFLQVTALYADGKYAAALAAGEPLVKRKFPREDGRPGEQWSPWRDHMRYLTGKIKHIQGDLKAAVARYREVAGSFEDARDSLAFFTRTELGAPATRSLRLKDAPTLEVKLKNQTAVKVRIYPVDLKVLFAVRKNLANVNAIDLTGIPAVATFEHKIAHAPQYEPFTRKLSLPIKQQGVYLVVLKAGDRDASTIVVKSDLDLEVQRTGRKVRAYVTLRSNGKPVAGALVRFADGRTIKAEGRTDPRGVFEGPNLSGKASTVVEFEGGFAFDQER